MAPARKINVDIRTILANIAAQADRQHDEVRADATEAADFWLSDEHRSPIEERRPKRDAELAASLARLLPQTVWVPRDLQLLAGKQLTASERIRHQQMLRKLEVDGFLELQPRHVRLTDAGRALVQKQAGHA